MIGIYFRVQSNIPVILLCVVFCFSFLFACFANLKNKKNKNQKQKQKKQGWVKLVVEKQV